MKLFKRQINQKSKRKKTLEEILDLFEKGGEIVERETFLQTLEDVKRILSKGGYVASIPSITYLRNNMSLDSFVWAQDLDGASIEYFGKDVNGLIEKRGEKYVIITHNLRLPTIKSLVNYKWGTNRVEKGIKYPQEILDNLLKGKTPQNENIDLYHIEDFLKIKERQNKRFGVIVPYSMIEKKGFIIGQKKYISSPFIRARKGVNEVELNLYSEKLMERLKDNVKLSKNRFVLLCNHNYLEDYLPSVQAQILYTSSLGISTGQNIGSNPHRFLVVKS